MSARFVVNFISLLVGAGLICVCFAFSASTFDWVAVGAGAAAIIAALTNFALANQGAYQRLADVVICAIGVFAVVAARVLAPDDRWPAFAAGAGLAALGALGLVVRELRLARGLQVGSARITTDQFAHMSAVQRDAGARS